MDREFVFERKQAGTLVLAAFLTDSFIQPFGRQMEVLPARTAILSGALQFALLCAVMAAYLRWCGGGKPGPVRSLLLCSALVLSIALEVIQGERFYNYVMQQQLAALLFLILLFGAAYYGAFAGVQALGRAAWPVLALAAASVLVLGWSVAGQMQFSRLQTPAASAGTQAQLALTRFYLPPELLLFPFLCPNGGSSRGAAKIIGAVFLANSLLALLGEMTLGAAYTSESQPVYTIARLGGLSVFRRLDALHVGVWLLLFLIKISLYFAGFIKLWQNVKACKGHCPYWVALAAVMVVFLAVWNQNEAAAMAVQQILLALALLAAPLNRLWNERGRNA
ncbi:MAG TPA: GerAB/ArcD/ProY family transporter [Candidatus Fournierella excrementigallinarum]|nr:GerAB/ArcD/ProY family transporter [Candidatus Fournierella excrementigallinarum]